MLWLFNAFLKFLLISRPNSPVKAADVTGTAMMCILTTMCQNIKYIEGDYHIDG